MDRLLMEKNLKIKILKPTNGEISDHPLYEQTDWTESTNPQGRDEVDNALKTTSAGKPLRQMQAVDRSHADVIYHSDMLGNVVLTTFGWNQDWQLPVVVNKSALLTLT